MATCTKTLVFAVPGDTATIADATVTNLPQITVQIPETVIAFVSAYVVVGVSSMSTATGGQVTEFRIGARLGAAAYTTHTETTDIIPGSRGFCVVLGPVSLLSHFTANWTGTSMTLDTQVYFDISTGTGLTTNNATAELFVTYTYDDSFSTNATQAKTVEFPLESLTGALPTSATNYGSSQIPQLTSGGVLPEPNVTILDYYFRITGSQNRAATTTDETLSFNIDGGATTSTGVYEAALAEASNIRWIYKPGSVPTLTAAHELQVWCDVASKYHHLQIELVVTYSHTVATRTLRSVLVPFKRFNWLTSPVTLRAELDIQDPGTITLRQSAVIVTQLRGLNNNAAHTVLVGAQSARTYTEGANNNIPGGSTSITQRIDSGGAQGASQTVVRGVNTFTLTVTKSLANEQHINAVVRLNYECDVAAAGIGANTTSVSVFERTIQYSTNRLAVNWTGALSLPTGYRLLTASLGLYRTFATEVNANFHLLYVSGDTYTAGSIDNGALNTRSNSAHGWMTDHVQLTQFYKRWATDPDVNRISPTATRGRDLIGHLQGGLTHEYTYHAMTYSYTDAVTGYAGSGSGLTVKVYDATTGEYQGSVTTTSGGAWTFTGHDSTRSKVAVCLEDATHTGATTTFLLS